MKVVLLNVYLPEVKKERPCERSAEIINTHQTCYPKAIFHGKYTTFKLSIKMILLLTLLL